MNIKIHIRKILIIVALVLPFCALNAQNNSDTITSQYPFPTANSVLPGYYGYHLSACLYTADEINHVAGEMKSLSYNIAPSNGYYYDYSSAKIWLVETEQSTLDLEQTWYDLTNSATLVYDGSIALDEEEQGISAPDVWHEFAFLQNFNYNGGGLIVVVQGEISDAYYGGTDYEIALYTNEGTEENCWILLQDSEMPDIHTNLHELVGAQHSNSEYRPDIFFSFTGGEEHDCVLNIPFEEDFSGYDAYSILPDCWIRISDEFISSYYCPTVSPGSASDNYNQNLFFMLMDTYSEMAVLPQLQEGLSVQDLTMTFKYNSAQQHSTVLAVGVMTDPNDTTTFQLVQTVEREGSVSDFENKAINFSNYSGNGRYIAFLFSREYSSSVFPSAFVDDISITTSAFCTPPVNVTTTVGDNSVTISWTNTNNATGVHIFFKNEDDDDFEDVEIEGVTSETFYNLPSGTTYTYFLASMCGDSVSANTDIYTFTTMCDAVTEFPWNESFENGIGCWTLSGSANGQNWALVQNGTHANFGYGTSNYLPYHGSNMMQFNAYSFTTGNWGLLASPKLDLSEERILIFNYHDCGQETYFDEEMFDQYPSDPEMYLLPIKEKIEVYINSEANLEGATLLSTVNGYSDESGWKTAMVNIPPQEYDSHIIFKAYYEGGFNMAIDNIVIKDSVFEDENIFVTIDTAICEGSSLEFHGSTYATAGTYTHNSGDTTFTINVTVNSTYNITINDSIVPGETYNKNGFNVSAAGTYTLNLQTVDGCDSIITLVLTEAVGTGDFSKAVLTVSPNPAKDYFYVSTSGLDSDVKIEIMDMSGRVLRCEKMIGGESVRIVRGNIPCGIYMVRISAGSTVQTKKLILR